MTAEPCRDRRGDVAALALGHLDPDGAARTLAHVDGCAACRAALHELERTARALATADPERFDSQPLPPPGLGERIAARVRDEANLRRHRTIRRRLVALAACAAALILVLAGALLLREDDTPTMHEFAVRAEGVEGWFGIEGSDQGTEVRLEHRGLDPSQMYWLWLTDASGTRVSAGTFFGTGERATVTLHSAMPEDDAVRIWVTDEGDDVVLDARIPR